MASKTLGSMGVVAWASRYKGRMEVGERESVAMSRTPAGLAVFRQAVKRFLALLLIILKALRITENVYKKDL